MPSAAAGAGGFIRAAPAAAFLAAALAAQAAPGGEIAFPGADGYGAAATGWRGGGVMRVDSLADHGPGTLRACAETGGAPRVCVFAVSGTISVDSPIMAGSNLYIAGQTAPGDGIQLRIRASTHGPLIVKDARDVVVRFLKLRPGPSQAPSATIDALTVENAERVFLGNLSMAFATDETFNIHVSGARALDITLADSILALSLDRSNHPKGRHSKGALVCSKEGVGVECGRISLLRNLFAHHRDRNPDVKATAIGPVEVLNNVFYDPISQFGEVYDLTGDLSLVYAGNVALPGPSTIRRTPEALQAFDWTEADIAITAWGNLAPSRPGCAGGRRARILDAVARAKRAEGPAPTGPVMPAAEAMAHVLARAGDVVPGRRTRDALDARVVANVAACRGRVIDGVEEVGGWPDPSPSPAIRDRDGDGLPDDWEARRPALNPARPDDVWAPDPATGLSHLETWLAVLAGDIAEPAPAAAESVE
jgi:hypothetical protein